jgi:predicted Zn finger-like uncharacterized protein
MEVVRVECPNCRAQLDVKNKLNVEQKVIKCPNCGFQMMVRFRQQPQYQQPQYQQPQYQQPPYQQPQYQQPPYQQPQYRQPVQDEGHTIYGGGVVQPQQFQQPRQFQQQPYQQQVPQQGYQQQVRQAQAIVNNMNNREATETIPASALSGGINPAVNTAAFLVYNNVRYPLNIGRNTIGRKPEDPNAPPKATVLIPTNGNKTMSRFHAVIESVRMQDGSIRSIISNGENKNTTFVAGVLLNGADKLILKNGAEIKMGSVLLRYELPV